MKEGEIVFRQLCSTFDSNGTTVPPVKTYETLTKDEKIALLEWREDILCEEFAEESRNFEEVISPLRPHNDRRFRYNADKTLILCPSFYDGCNCKPDHTQEDWNNLNDRLKEAEDRAAEMESRYDRLTVAYGILEGQHDKGC